MKTYFKTMTSVIVVLLFTWLPVTVSGDSLADKRSDTPVETWGSTDVELERAILTEQMDPTAAGPVSAEHQQDTMMQDSMHSEGHMSKDDMEHGMKQYNSASHYKREVFGNNR